MKKLKSLFWLILVFCTLLANAQSAKVTKAQIKAEEKKKEQLRNEEKAEIKGIKKHESIQTAKVRKRMRKHRKGDIHVDAYDKKPGFFRRLFHRRRH